LIDNKLTIARKGWEVYTVEWGGYIGGNR